MIPILYEDDSLLVVDKPAGMPTLALSPPDRRSSLEAAVAALCPKLDLVPEHGIVHRLDNGTSGIMCIGKSTSVYNILRDSFSAGNVIKRYAALVLGIPPVTGTIDAPIAHHPRKKTKMVVCESASRAQHLKARPAQTNYTVTRRYRHHTAGHMTSYALLDVLIRTGVRHQIRAHLAWDGHPIAGDRLYQNARKRASDRLPFGRYFLHARSIELKHPHSNRLVVFESPLPEALMTAIALMEQLPETRAPR